jgi:putative oxidoreductase
MQTAFGSRFGLVALTALRVAAGLAFFSHGAQKMLGWFGGIGPDGGTAPLISRFGLAGGIELVAGLCIALGLATRPLAFLASGEMAVAYFWMHWGRTGEMWWWQNRGELAMVYAFVWLLFAAGGAGPWSVEGWLAKRRSTPVTG